MDFRLSLSKFRLRADFIEASSFAGRKVGVVFPVGCAVGSFWFIIDCVVDDGFIDGVADGFIDGVADGVADGFIVGVVDDGVVDDGVVDGVLDGVVDDGVVDGLIS